MKKFDIPLMETAYTFSQMSYCDRLKVGAVIAKDGRPISVGFNGTVPGVDNVCEEELICEKCSGNGCEYCNDGVIYKTSDFVVHAEQNAIYFAAKNGVSVDGCDLFITHSPCPNCAKAIVSSGIKRVVYDQIYRDDSGIQFLQKCGIEVDHIDF